MGANFVHENNIYWLMGAGKFDLSTPSSLGISDSIANPEFVSFSFTGERVNPTGLDLRLKQTSPALNSATTSVYDVDILKNPVPKGAGPDIGAFESY